MKASERKRKDLARQIWTQRRGSFDTICNLRIKVRSPEYAEAFRRTDEITNQKFLDQEARNRLFNKLCRLLNKIREQEARPC